MTATCKKCGGPATPIIGTFSVCPKCDGAKVPSGRGEPGHVEMCACKRCQIRRRVCAIEFVGRTGEVLGRFNWDGHTVKPTWRATATGQIAHWHALDAEGHRVGGGACVSQATSAPALIHVIKDQEYWFGVEGVFDGICVVVHLPTTPIFPQSKIDEYVGKAWTFDIPQRSTISELHAAAMAVSGVAGVRIQEDHKHATVFVIVTETYALDEDEELAIFSKVSDVVQRLHSAGMSYQTVRNTPLCLFSSAVRVAQREVSKSQPLANTDRDGGARALRVVAFAAALEVIRKHGGEPAHFTVTSDWNAYGDVRLRLHYRGTWREYNYEILVHR